MIEINEKYFMEVDNSPVCFTLKRRWMSQPKDGSEAFERVAVVGYYGTVEAALNGLVDQVVADELKDGSYSLRQARDKIVASREEMAALIKEAYGQAKDL